jgi:hypothetical protein
MTKKIEGMATIDEDANGKKTIEFAPGCFDSFDGTQEELDQMIAEITAMFTSGELEERARIVDIENLIEEDPDMAERVFEALQRDENQRKLQ